MKKTPLLMRSLALLLCMLMLGSMLIACRKEEEPVETEPETSEVVTSETVTETETIDDKEELPEVNYGGKAFKMLLRKNEDHVKDMYFKSIQEAKEAVDMKVFARNKAVESRFGVVIECDQSEGDGNTDTAQLNAILGGEANYHLIGNHGRSMFVYATSLTLADWNQLNYLQTDKAYWCGGMREEFTINGKLFCFRGDMSIESLSSTVVMLFNKTLCAANGMDYPYDLVEEGEWTFEKFKTMALTVGDPNGAQVKLDENTEIGYMSTQFRGPITVLYSAGKSIVELNEEKTNVVLTLPEGDTDQLYKDYFGLIDQNNVYCEGRESGKILKRFSDGQVLFFDCRLSSIGQIIANGMDDYGILPWPKYNEDVEEYYSWCDPWGNTFGIPRTHTADELDFVAIITEAMCAEGYREVMPVYYDTILLGQQATDASSAEMIEYIRAGRRYDIASYMMTGSDYGSIGNCGTILLTYQDHSFSNWWASKQTQATTGLRNINALFSIATK